MSRSAYRGIALLTLVNLFNYIDRYVVSAVVGSLQQDSALAINDEQAGLLMTSFVVVYTFASPIFGRLGDTTNRPRLLAFGVALWSLATAGGGLAGSFLALLFARALVGVGEAAYGTVSGPMIADWFGPESRGKAYGIYFMAIPLGAALGYVLGGLVDAAYGWRMAFFVAGVPGILLAIAVSRLADPPRGQMDTEGKHEPDPRPSMAVYLELLRERQGFRYATLGYGAYTFAVGGLAFWMPTYLERIHGLSRSDATVEFGGVVFITGLIGTLSGGWLLDRIRHRVPSAAMLICAVSTLAAVPFIFGVLTAESRTLGTICLVAAQLLLFTSTGPVNTALVELVPVPQRARASALAILLMHLIGDVPSPPLIGWLSDRHGLDIALFLVPAAVVLSGMLWGYAAKVGRGTDSATPDMATGA